MSASEMQEVRRKDEHLANALKALLAILVHNGVITKEQEQAMLKEAGFSKECKEVYR